MPELTADQALLRDLDGVWCLGGRFTEKYPLGISEMYPIHAAALKAFHRRFPKVVLGEIFERISEDNGGVSWEKSCQVFFLKEHLKEKK